MLMVGTIQRLASLGKVRRGFTGRCLNIRRPVSEILFETFEGVDSSNISFIKKHDVSYSYHSFASHSGFYFPPAANKDRAVNSMEIKDFIILWTYSQWRQAIVVIPPFLSIEGNVLHDSVNQLLHACSLLRGKSATCYRYSQALTYSNLLSTIFDGPPLSPERETYGMLLFIQLLHSCLLRRGKGATCYRYSQALTYSILLSTIFDGPPSLSREGNVLHASLRTAFAFLSFKQRK